MGGNLFWLCWVMGGDFQQENNDGLEEENKGWWVWGGVQEKIKDLEEGIREGVMESQRGGVHNKMEPTELVQVEGVGVEHKMAQWLDGGGWVCL